MTDAHAVIDPAFTVGRVDDRLFGSFVEHMGRAVYGGIFEPGHPSATADGWRGDVLELVRDLGVTVVRYPGGNFVSGYDWEDGVGPRSRRPTRPDLAWRSLEPNSVGTDEFIDWARSAGAEPMLAVNLGTRGAGAARDLVEYCNGPGGSPYADRRVANGHPDPHAVRLWCLGNEMDGPWQIGHKTAAEYGRLAAEAGAAMRLVDPTIELVVCGSSGAGMPTFGTWEDTVLDLAWDVADHVSVHAYYDPGEYPDVADYLACPVEFDRQIEAVVAAVDAVARRLGSPKRIGLSVDEWNVWHRTANPLDVDPAGEFRGPRPLAEDEHDIADALVVGSLLITLLGHADRIRIGCLAQLVNVIPVIRTLDGGPAWRQTTYYPFQHVSRFGRGTALRLELDGPTYPVTSGARVGAVDAAAVLDADGTALTLFAVNRIDRPVPLRAALRDLDGLVPSDHLVLRGRRIDASNTADHPDRVRPVRGSGATVSGASLAVDLPARSWTVLRLTGGPRAAVA